MTANDRRELQAHLEEIDICITAAQKRLYLAIESPLNILNPVKQARKIEVASGALRYWIRRYERELKKFINN